MHCVEYVILYNIKYAYARRVSRLKMLINLSIYLVIMVPLGICLTRRLYMSIFHFSAIPASIVMHEYELQRKSRT